MDDDINLDALTEEQRKVVLKLVDQKVADMAGNTDDLKLSKDEKHWKQDAKRLDKMRQIWRNNGYIPGTRERIGFTDLVKKDWEITQQIRNSDATFSQEQPLLIPRVISEIAREALEPALVLTPLLQRVNFSAGTRIIFPAWGSIAEGAHIAEGAEYPERSMELAGETEAIIGKYGLAVSISEEARRYGLYDIMSMHIRQAGKAMARLKERLTAELLTADYGNIIFDNNSASYKSTTGRDAGGSYNGTLTLDDLFYAHAKMIQRGFVPNTLIMHPLAWQIFSEDSISRAFGFQHGMPEMMWRLPQGSPGNAPSWRHPGLNQNTQVTSHGQLATTFTNVPTIFPTNYRIIVSPYMPFNETTNLTDIIFCDSSELGLLVVDEELTTDEWNDPARDIVKMKFRERYGHAMVNNGQGIGLMKNIKVTKGYAFADRLSVNIDATGLGNLLTGDQSNFGTTV